MFRPRVIAVLLLKEKGLVKTVRFNKSKATYIGDPVNAVKIFNDKLADELVFLDINAGMNKSAVSPDIVRNLGEECNMPFSVGGGIRSLESIHLLLNAGAEKVIICSFAAQCPAFVKQASEAFGSSTIVVCIDVKKTLSGRQVVYISGGKRSTGLDPVNFAKQMEDMGCGEIIINSVDLDGTMLGYDLNLVKTISGSVSVPVVALGGAGNLEHFREAVSCGASAVAAGSLFVFHGRQNAVLISFPSQQELRYLFK